MRPRGTGHIVNVASSAGKTGFPNLATYCATKHGVGRTLRGRAPRAARHRRRDLRGDAGHRETELSPASSTRGPSRARRSTTSRTEVVDALKFPRFDVFVPKSIGPTWALFNLVPRRGREALARALKTTAPRATPTRTPAPPTRPVQRRARLPPRRS